MPGRAKSLEKAIELDRTYASAYAWLALTHYFGFELGWSDRPETSLGTGLGYARKAVELDPSNSIGHHFMGYGLIYSRQFDAGWSHMERARELNPNDADTLALMGLFHAYLGRPEEGIRLIEEAWRLNPLETEWYRWNQAIVLYTAHRYDESVTAYLRLINPANEAVACMAAGYAQLGDEKAAHSLMADFRERAKDELATYPGDDPQGWLRYWTNSFPYKDPADFEHLLDGLRKAGLPV